MIKKYLNRGKEFISNTTIFFPVAEFLFVETGIKFKVVKYYRERQYETE